MDRQGLTIAVVAGEVSGDLLGADLVAALKRQTGRPVSLTGVGGPGLAAEGLVSLFDYSELSVMGITQVIGKLPSLLSRIRSTAEAIIRVRPDALLIIDSPDFTHRVAKRVRAALPNLPVVNYVCPSVWAWKEYRAPAMTAYVDRVLALLPFEPEVMEKLGGPRTDFIGHRLTADRDVLAVRERRWLSAEQGRQAIPTLLLLPGSRAGEIRRLLPDFRATVDIFAERNGIPRLLLPTVPRQEELVRAMTADWTYKPEISVGPEAKWRAFAEADAALAASGTVVLELGLAGVPVVSTYRTDWLIKLVTDRIKIWSGALPNLIADYVIVPEYFNERIRAAALARWLERLSRDTPERVTMMAGFDTVWARMQRPEPPGEAGARLLLQTIAQKKTGHL